MKKLISVIVLQIIISNTFAQIPNYDWSINFGNSLNDEARSIAVDNSGNVYVTGTINGTVDLDPTAGTYNIISNGGSNDFFIAKYDSSGNIIWGFRRGSSAYDVARKIKIDNNNNLIIVGSFSGSFDFDPSAGGNTTLTAGTNGSAFVAKYDSAGNFIWAFKLGSTSLYADAYNLDIDANDNIYIIGTFEGTADFNPANGQPANLTAINGDAIYVAKYDSASTYSWAFMIDATTSNTGIGISVDPIGNVYITGEFQGTADFNPSAGVSNLTSNSGDEIFIAKYSAASNYIWAYEVGSTGDDIGTDINAKTSGVFYLTGAIEGYTDFDVTGGGYPVFTNGLRNAFVAKYDINAAIQWAYSFGQPTGYSLPFSLTTDLLGNVYAAGIFTGTIDFNPSSNVDTITTATSTFSGFVTKFSSSGTYNSTFQLPSTNRTYPYQVLTDISNNLLLCGIFQGTSDFDPSTGNTNTLSNGLNDGFIAKYSFSTTGIQDISTNDNILFYPNPFSTFLTLKGIAPESNLKLFNSEGILVREFKSNSNEMEIGLKDLSQGMYLIQITNKDKMFSRKIIKQ